MEKFDYKYFASPLGDIEIKYNSDFILHVLFMKEGLNRMKENEGETGITNAINKQLKEYFNGELKCFDLPLQYAGTDFQKKVWTELRKIDFGKTISYLQMAKKLGDIKCIRAAASANGKNPFAIIVPCHRVIGSNGSLTGYAGGLWRKQWLLDHEAKAEGRFQKLF